MCGGLLTILVEGRVEERFKVRKISIYLYLSFLTFNRTHKVIFLCVVIILLLGQRIFLFHFFFVLRDSIIIKQGVINVRQYSIFAGLFFKINQKMSACTMTKWPPIAFRNEVTPLGVSKVSTILFLERRLFLRDFNRTYHGRTMKHAKMHRSFWSL